jgi:hypothetical protein
MIIRDIWSPEKNATYHTLEMPSDVWELFKDFLARSPERVEIEELDEQRRSVKLSTRWAVEFLSKKDYHQHWDLELKEIYTGVPMSVYRDVARTLRLDVIRAAPLRNDWIVENRWRNGVRGALPEFTNQLIVLGKM